MQIHTYADENYGNLTVHPFYVKYLLPIWFDVQSFTYKDGAGPAKRWRYV
jgi:hypothetical protein